MIFFEFIRALNNSTFLVCIKNKEKHLCLNLSKFLSHREPASIVSVINIHKTPEWLLVLLQSTSSPFTVFRWKYKPIHPVSTLLNRYAYTWKKLGFSYTSLPLAGHHYPKLSDCKCYLGTSEDRHRSCLIFLLTCCLPTTHSLPLTAHHVTENWSLKIYHRENVPTHFFVLHTDIETYLSTWNEKSTLVMC